MTFRSLLTVFVEEAGFDPALEAATVLARQHDAHLDVLTLGAGRAVYSGGFPVIEGTTVMAAMREAGALSAKLAARARARLEGEDIRWAVEDAGAQVLGIGDSVATRARYADLVVLPRPLGKDHGSEGEMVTEAALFGGHAPVLVIPPKGLRPAAIDSVVVGWDGGDEAMAAVRAALPLLRTARVVSVTVVDPGRLNREADDPGGAVARYLVRHGVNAEVTVLARTAARVAELLNQNVRDRGAGLLVMGAYGHARLRELLLGGTTRDMLAGAEVPVLLAR